MSDWKTFKLEELIKKVEGDEPRIHEFLKAPGMSCAVYHLPRGCKDMQSPHAEDEIYIVLKGSARLSVNDEEQSVGPGTVLFVKANTQHSFFDIDEDLTVLALFGPQG